MRKRRRAKRWSGVNEILSRVMKRVAPAHELAGYAVWSFWDDEVGEAIARRAQPTHFRNGVLIVTVATHAWIQELQFMKESIRERLNARLPEAVIRDIYFTSGKLEAPPPAPPPPPSPPGKALIEMPQIDDEMVRDAIARVIGARARRINKS